MTHLQSAGNTDVSPFFPQLTHKKQKPYFRIKELEISFQSFSLAHVLSADMEGAGFMILWPFTRWAVEV